MTSTELRRAFDLVVGACSQATGIPREALLSRGKTHKVSRARMVAMWLMRETCECALVQVSGRFNRHHTTVMHACRVTSAEVATGQGPTFSIVVAAIAIMEKRPPKTPSMRHAQEHPAP